MLNAAFFIARNGRRIYRGAKVFAGAVGRAYKKYPIGRRGVYQAGGLAAVGGGTYAASKYIR